MNMRQSVIGLSRHHFVITTCLCLALMQAKPMMAQYRKLPRRDNTRGHDPDEYDQDILRNLPDRKKAKSNSSLKPVIVRTRAYQNFIYLGMPVGTSLSNLYVNDTRLQFNYTYTNDPTPHVYVSEMRSATQQQPFWDGMLGIEFGMVRGPFVAFRFQAGKASQVYSEGLELQLGMNYRLGNTPWMLTMSTLEESNYAFYTLPQTIDLSRASATVLGQKYEVDASGGNPINVRINNYSHTLKLQFGIRHDIRSDDIHLSMPWWRFNVGYTWTMTSGPGVEIDQGKNQRSIAYNSDGIQFTSLQGTPQTTYLYNGPYFEFDFGIANINFFRASHEGEVKRKWR